MNRDNAPEPPVLNQATGDGPLRAGLVGVGVIEDKLRLASLRLTHRNCPKTTEYGLIFSPSGDSSLRR